MPFTCSDILKIVLAVIFPPLGVFLERGCGVDLLINVLLTVLGWIPGIIHALYISEFLRAFWGILGADGKSSNIETGPDGPKRT